MSNPIAKKLLAAVDAAIAPALPNTLHVLRQKAEIEVGHQIPNKEDAALLKSEHAAWLRCWTAANHEYTEENAKRLHAFHLELHGAIAEEGALAGVTTRGFESFRDEVLGKQAAAKDQCSRISKRTAPLIERTTRDFVDGLAQWIKKRESVERAESKEFGISFSPSPILAVAVAAHAQFKSRLETGIQGHAVVSVAMPFCEMKTIEDAIAEAKKETKKPKANL